MPFLPAIYEQKAWFVHSTPSIVCRDPELFTQALLAEFEIVRPDALTIGIDVYNVEAEAVGARVIYYDGEDPSIPAVDPDGTIFHGEEDIVNLRLPDPQKDGRMPLHLGVARRVLAKLGNELPVRGAVTGPFSLAAHLVGAEHLFMLTITHPALVKKLLRFSLEVAKEYSAAYVKVGCGVVIFDSQASPEILSPAMYRTFVLEPTKRLIDFIHSLGLRHVPLIIGGNTTKILDAYLETGANNILCDFSADVERFREQCSVTGRAFRRNIDTADFLTLSREDLIARAKKCIDESRGYPGFIFGTGVVPFGTPVGHFAILRNVLHEYAR